MKLNKKTAMIVSFALGSVMFATTAMAQVLTKSGYDQLKDSVKYTAESATTKLTSYTADMSIILKDNGTVVYSDDSLSKVDVAKGAKETVTKGIDGLKKTEEYNYSDLNESIYKNNTNNIYNTTTFTTPHKTTISQNPFKEEGATDMEKIADAVVGNLKDAVVVTQNSDGSKTLSGSLSEAQIPALINAVVSLESKSVFGGRSNNPNNESSIPKIVSDVFVKEVKGNMVTTKDGLIQTVLGTGLISGKDAKGVEHKLTFELLAKMTDVNTTKANKPDLTGKKVEKNVEQDHSKLTNPEKYLGKYKTDILIEKDAKFVKIGERFVDITALDNKGVSGRYYEEYAKGFEEYAVDKKDFKFSSTFEKGQFNGSVKAPNFTGSISIDQGSATIYFNANENSNENVISSNGNYSKVFK
ncbi:hypothetical protein LL037_02560 [Clostridium estertheticum]|uniref:S-layer protein n=1 Tax=Clostridium estertheticum TaxID=238834 RepID=A0AA47I6G3_9CLOT|nr:hypothetical protein [Clostridium estertheticum]MBU3156292.1 hypothetical protein [Clostridium estertheticum]MBU3200795.1 hypothetical protein [Clostridium estertheticum]WAG59810.1 hypothetical protein LL038_19935 [Clostridium estertheticum]WAG66119.1 hypothetical protein LL037_02560 [Clostridium estertheticum]